MDHSPPLVVHLIYRLDFGGLETLLIDCINGMPDDRYRHAVVCLTDYTEFAGKIRKPGVSLHALHKPPGLAPATHLHLWRLLRRLRPAILHTYNLPAIEYAPAAALARVPVRVHGEHGRDARDPQGTNRRHNLLRRLVLPFYDCYYAVSADLRDWLRNTIGVPDRKNLLLENGVDTGKFHPVEGGVRQAMAQLPAGCFVFGTVGRIQDVKDHAGLVDAFIALLALLPQQRSRLRLAIVGEGPLLPALKQKIAAAGIEDLVWLPGGRMDVDALMRSFSVFTLSSIAEGTPVTILEAMASALPVISTRVGGVPEVVVDGVTGTLVPPSDPQAMARAMAAYVEQPHLAARHGAAGHERSQRQYSMNAMLQAYAGMYDRMLAAKQRRDTV
ncbi:TIGR03088 family PEP-CTERM/XrtA system glycosyltransferase [Herbaspirillum robiniae]|uniref:TIGR03088 family PEP-CTERM/XrtA system glycosyltransferase n=1 Tax=Herbaspirillum robiniae TaxID=2014887 RepID=A0ABX2LTN5_9BURK|nr:TIGR03088 family PEP-CTERM/XrtA system glycosyltransferase [Herbaspirillum robiniae]NUU01804.1 TIGR03088 family PEP-CTERM/XrtA system glycosyltransferase [Herbaspirillum robiniae]